MHKVRVGRFGRVGMRGDAHRQDASTTRAPMLLGSRLAVERCLRGKAAVFDARYSIKTSKIRIPVERG